MDNNITKSANQVFKAIKDKLTANKKTVKDNKRSAYNSIEVSWDNKVPSVFNPKTGKYELGNTTYQIWVEGDKVLDGIESTNDLAKIFNAVRDLLDDLKAKKGWGTLTHTSETIRPASSGSNWVIPSLSVLTKVELPDAPCKEYKSLANYLNKYGLEKKYGYYGLSSLDLTPFELYSVYAGGKRGVIYGEEGNRHYLANKPKKCAQVLAELRKHRTAKDTMVCTRGREEYIDPTEKMYSMHQEVECDGEIRSYLSVAIKTDTGKVKYETKLY